MKRYMLKKNYIVDTDRVGPVEADTITEALIWASRFKAIGMVANITPNPNPVKVEIR